MTDLEGLTHCVLQLAVSVKAGTWMSQSNFPLALPVGDWQCSVSAVKFVHAAAAGKPASCRETCELSSVSEIFFPQQRL